MNALDQVVFCHVHGYAHDDGEMDAEPDEPDCHEEEWDNVVQGEAEVISDEEETVNEQVEGLFMLKSGDLAYIYTVRGGLVPCKVLVVKDDGETEVIVTASRPGWKRGDWELIRNPRISLVNRNQVSHRRGIARVTGALAMVTDKGKVLR